MATGRSSRRNILIVAIVAVVMAAGGFLAARLIVSPEDAAARTAAPPSGPITVAVERKALDASVVTRGDIGFSDSVEVTLADGGATGAAAVVTGRVPEVGSVVDNATVLLEVTGRPVLALSGELPTYRTLVPGSSGPDVEQLESTLAGLGIDPGPADRLYDAATGAAVAKLYQTVGYEPPTASEESAAAVTAAQSAATTAAQAVTEARALLDAAAGGPTRSERLALQAAVDGAQAAYNEATVTRSPPDQAAVDQAARALASATDEQARAEAALQQARDEQQTGLADLEAAVTGAGAAVDDAQDAVDAANRGGPPSPAAIAAAKSALDIAKAQQQEGLQVDTSAEQAALTAAEQGAATAAADLAAAQAAAVTPFPAQEVVWLASMPRRVDEVLVARGTVIDGTVLRVSGADLAVRAQVSREEAGLLKAEMPAELAIPGEPPIAAVITSVGDAAPAPAPEPGELDGGGDTDGGQPAGTVVLLQPQDVTNEQAQALRGANVKVTIPVASTSGAVLVVPVAGLFSDAAGTPRVEIVGSDGVTRFQPVKLGLSTGGEVEVQPVDEQGRLQPPGWATLDEGSLVVVGR